MKWPHHGLNPSTIKDQILVHDFYLKEQALDRFKARSGGWVEAGLCPFHKDTNAGSFRINLENGAFTCFSCGAKGGDIISFAMKKYGHSFSQAIQQLAKEWGCHE